MLMISLILFIAAALGGIFLLSYVLQKKNTPKSIALIHGGVASLALILLIIAAIQESNLWLNVILFILVASGGIYLFTTDILGKKVSRTIGVIHGMAALFAIILLAFVIFYLH